jgi:hypothetical protein
MSLSLLAAAQRRRLPRHLQCPLDVEICQCANSDRSLTVRKKMVAVRGPCRSGCGAIITQCSTRDLGGPFRRPQAGFIDLWVWMRPVSRSKRPVRGPSNDPKGPAAVLGVSMSSPALALPRSSPCVYGWPFWTYGSSMVRAKLQICSAAVPGRGSSGSVDPIVLPSSICARAVPLLPGLPRLL